MLLKDTCPQSVCIVNPIGLQDQILNNNFAIARLKLHLKVIK